MGIRTYCQNRSHKHIGVMSDSPTAITIKNAIKLQKILWLWCFKNTSFISAAHISRKHNIEADKCFTKFNNNTGWQLNRKIFIEITEVFLQRH